MFGLLKYSKEALALAEKATESANYWKSQYDALRRQEGRSHWDNVLAQVCKEKAHLERVLARKNRRLKLLEPVWRRFRDCDTRRMTLISGGCGPDQAEMAEKATDLANWMKQNGYTSFGPIDLRE